MPLRRPRRVSNPNPANVMSILERPAVSYRKARPEVREMWNRAFFRTIRVRDGSIADFTYEEPLARLWTWPDDV